LQRLTWRFPMDTKVKDRLVKLLNLTTSDNDNEALLALRNAQKILKTENASWEFLLSGRTVCRDLPNQKQERYEKTASNKLDLKKTPIAPRGKEAKKDFNAIKQLFHFLDEKTLQPEQAKFVKSLHSYWVLHGRLSEKQEKCLQGICVRLRWKEA
jgi:hypothetical protein